LRRTSSTASPASLATVKPVEDGEGLWGALGGDGKKRLPHVAGDEAQPGDVLAEVVEEAVERRGRAVGPEPEEAAAALVNLVDHREVNLALLPGQLVHADSRDALETLVLQPPFDRRADGLEDDVPADVEAARDLLPGQHLRPRREVPAERVRDGALALCPGDLLHRDAAPGAVAATRPIDEEDGQRGEHRQIPVGTLGELVVAGRRLAAVAAARLAALLGAKANVEPWATAAALQPGLAVDEARLSDRRS
jgi:hypothetical protein